MGRCGTWLPFYPLLAFHCAVCIGITLPATAWAKPPDSDGIYGRLDGDIALCPSLGLEHYRGDSQAAIGLQAMYFSTLGLSLHHADSDFLVGKRSVNRSATSLDMQLTPLFLTRWSQAMEVGPRFLDLLVDSFKLGLGAYWEYDRGIGQVRRGSAVSTGLGVPLANRANGPWLNATVALRFAEGPGYSAPAEMMYSIAFSWAWFVDSRLHDDNP